MTRGNPHPSAGWKKGQSGNPKGKALMKERGEDTTINPYAHITRRKCKMKDWEEIVGRAVDDAKRGDWRARDFLEKQLQARPASPQTGADQFLGAVGKVLDRLYETPQLTEQIIDAEVVNDRIGDDPQEGA